MSLCNLSFRASSRHAPQMRLPQQVISQKTRAASQASSHRTHADRSTFGFSAEADSDLGTRLSAGATSGFCSCSGSDLDLSSGTVVAEVPIIRDSSNGVRISREGAGLEVVTVRDVLPEGACCRVQKVSSWASSCVNRQRVTNLLPLNRWFMSGTILSRHNKSFQTGIDGAMKTRGLGEVLLMEKLEGMKEICSPNYGFWEIINCHQERD